jgi:hypothetical protein
LVCVCAQVLNSTTVNERVASLSDEMASPRFLGKFGETISRVQV